MHEALQKKAILLTFSSGQISFNFLSNSAMFHCPNALVDGS